MKALPWTDSIPEINPIAPNKINVKYLIIPLLKSIPRLVDENITTNLKGMISDLKPKNLRKKFIFGLRRNVLGF